MPQAKATTTTTTASATPLKVVESPRIPTAIAAAKLADDFISKRIPELNAAMPWKLIPEKVVESDVAETVAGFKLPKLFTIPTSLALILDTFLEDNNYFKDSPLGFVGTDSAYTLTLATLLLRFYFDLDWSVEKTWALTERDRRELTKYLEQERRGWVEPEVSDEPATEGKDEPQTGFESSGDFATSIPRSSIEEALA